MFSSFVRNVLYSRAILPKCLRTCSPSVLQFSSKTHLAVKQEVLPSDGDIRLTTTKTIQKINDLVARGAEGRLFAVVHVAGKQFKITPEDIIIIEGYWPPTNGDQIKLEKVMLVGGTDFTLIGRPILPHGLVTVRATVIEKDLSHTKPHFYKKRRKQYQRLNYGHLSRYLEHGGRKIHVFPVGGGGGLHQPLHLNERDFLALRSEGVKDIKVWQDIIQIYKHQ